MLSQCIPDQEGQTFNERAFVSPETQTFQSRCTSTSTTVGIPVARLVDGAAAFVDIQGIGFRKTFAALVAGALGTLTL